MTIGTDLDTFNAATTADLAALHGLVTDLTGRVANLETAVAKLIAAVPPVVVPPYDPQVKWKASFEAGNLLEWSEKVNSGTADSTVVSTIAHSGTYCMQQSVTGASGGTRMQRYPEVDTLARAGTPFYWTWWDYFPTPISFGIFDTFIIWGAWSVKVATPGALPDAFWALVFHNTGNTLDLIFNPTSNAGLPARHGYTSSVPVPVGQWIKFEVYVNPAGHITVWMNGAQLFDVAQIMQYPFVGQTPLLFGIEQTGYGSNLTPTPCTHYVDDVSVSLGRMP
jgi:hypothetical protein